MFPILAFNTWMLCRLLFNDYQYRKNRQNKLLSTAHIGQNHLFVSFKNNEPRRAS